MLPVSQTQTFNNDNAYQMSQANTLMVIFIFTLLSFVMGVVYMIIIFYSNKIITPIKKLDRYTE